MAANVQVSAAGKPLASNVRMDTTLRGVSALRLSVLTDETTSPDRQREANHAAAAALGIDLGDREAVDLGVSASKTTPFERPELGSWLRRPDEFDALCFWRFDRAVRSMDDIHALSKWARENRKMIVFAEGPGGRLVLDFRNPLDPMAQLMVTVFAFAAQMEAQAIRERVTGAQAAMRVMPFRWRGSRPHYGYEPKELETGGWTLTPDAAAVAVIERMISELMSGRTASAVAVGLNEDGIPTPRDHWAIRQGRKTGGKTGGAKGEHATRDRFKWGPSIVKKVLTSVALLGWKTHKGKPVRDSEGAPVLATAEPILTREEFDAVGALFAARAVDNRERKDTNALLLRVIHCANCGGRMYYSLPTGKNVSASYTCNAHARGDRCDAPAAVKAEWVDEYVEREFLDSVGGLRLTQTTTIPGYDPQPEIAATLAEFTAHQEEQGRQRSKAARDAWQKRADALDARLAELEGREATEARTEVTQLDRTFADEWKAADTAARRRMLVDAGAHLTVKRGVRGGWRRLDERRVRFELRSSFFAGAADELAAIARVEMAA